MKRFLKRVFKKFALLVWTPIGPRFYTRVDWRIHEQLALIDSGQINSSWKQHIPAFLNAVSTVQAFGYELVQSKTEFHSELVQSKTEFHSELAQVRDRLTDQVQDEAANVRTELTGELTSVIGATNERVDKAFDRIEFVRREIMYELLYGRRKGNGSQDIAASPVRVLNPNRLAAAHETGIRLNIGCGHIPLDGYINVDMRELPGVDLVAEAGDLPFENMSIQEVFSAHLVEHFPQEELVRRLLPHWYDLLVHGGRFRAIAPDGEAMLAGFAAGTYSFEDFREVLFGAQDYNGDFHYNLLTPSSFSLLLEKARFNNVTVLDRGRHNGKCFEFEVCATK